MRGMKAEEKEIVQSCTAILCVGEQMCHTQEKCRGGWPP